MLYYAILYAMLYYMLCYAILYVVLIYMLCYDIILCYIILYAMLYAMLCYIILYYMLCYMLCYALLYYMLCYAILFLCSANYTILLYTVDWYDISAPQFLQLWNGIITLMPPKQRCAKESKQHSIWRAPFLLLHGSIQYTSIVSERLGRPWETSGCCLFFVKQPSSTAVRIMSLR